MSWVIVPAAGIGSRMQADVPKQYLRVLGKTILEHTLQRLLSHPLIEGAMVALAADDPHAARLALAFPKPVLRCVGGADRAASVCAALLALPPEVSDQHWVLVHDAARPCVRHEDLDRLFAALHDVEPVGALLAAPVRDTLKTATAATAHIESTVDRRRYWRAFTPQAFRRGELLSALRQAQSQHTEITDEASAMEHLGLQPRLIEGSDDNIKLTTPADLALVEFLLRRQMQ